MHDCVMYLSLRLDKNDAKNTFQRINNSVPAYNLSHLKKKVNSKSRVHQGLLTFPLSFEKSREMFRVGILLWLQVQNHYVSALPVSICSAIDINNIVVVTASMGGGNPKEE